MGWNHRRKAKSFRRICLFVESKKSGWKRCNEVGQYYFDALIFFCEGKFMMKRVYISFFIFIFSANNFFAQDIHFSQFNENPMHINPAYTGMFDGLFRVTMNYRSQWASM